MSQDESQSVPLVRTISRRKVLGWSGTFAASVIQGNAIPLALAEQVSASPRSQKGTKTTIDAKPAAIEIDLQATAVIVIDMQNDFASKGGMLDRNGADLTPIQRAVQPTASVIAGARHQGMKVIYLKMAMKPDLSDVGPRESPSQIANKNAGVGTKMRAPDGSEGRILVRDTWNTAIIDQLKPDPADIQIYKHRYSGFFETDLDSTLKNLGVRYLIVTGCTTSVCVESTIRDAMFRDYSAILLSDCTGEVFGNDLPRSNHESSLYVIAGRNFGWVSSSSEFLKSIQA
jgi:ureidoacrylate peracid hydrolase